MIAKESGERAGESNYAPITDDSRGFSGRASIAILKHALHFDGR
jgi:hypothetical protein